LNIKRHKKQTFVEVELERVFRIITAGLFVSLY